MRSLAAVLFAASLGACGSSLSGPTPAHDVLVTLTVPGPCISGGCDPAGTSSVLGVVSVVNNGTATAYVPTCGTVLAFSEQQLIGGQWMNVGPAFACTAPSTPIAIAPGANVQTNWTFTPGRWRLVIGVASAADLSDEALATSAGIRVF